MPLPIIMHVNYCEQGQTIPEMCHKAVAWGYDGIEFRRKRRIVDEIPEAYLDEVARSAEDAGLKHVLFGGPGINLAKEDAVERKAQIKEGLRFYRLAAERVKLTVCNVGAGLIPRRDKTAQAGDYRASGSGAATEDHYKWAAEGYRELGALAEEFGFRMAFETHMECLTDLPEPTKKLLDMIDSPAVGANLDYGNMIHFANAPSLGKAISILKDRLYMVHLKNAYRVGIGDLPVMVRCPLGDGIINNREFIRLLREDGFQGPICIESPREGDREWFAQQDIHYLKSLLNDIDW